MDPESTVGDSQAGGERRRLAWYPNSVPQGLLLECPVYEVFFGGARGGGKTDGVIGDWAQHAALYGKDAVGLMVRRTSTQLTETVERAKAILRPVGATFLGKPDRCRMPNGARLSFAYLERDADAEQYQGHSYTRVYVEEAGNFPSPDPILKLHATLRSGAGVPCRMRLTGNPGGPGHQWLKARYIDPAPQGMAPIYDQVTGLPRVYIPSRVKDNVSIDIDAYVAQLRMSGSPALVAAWLEGDWDVVAGAFFPEFERHRHVVSPRDLPSHWARFRAMDWGHAAPFAVYWFAVSDGELAQFPRGALIVYREWYGSDGQPNVGLRLTAEEVARGISEREVPGEVTRGVADPSMFAQSGGPSIAERMNRAARLGLYPADNKRVAAVGAMGGWDQVRARLKGDGDRPGLYFFDTCRDLIRTLPALQHDPDRMEDLDTDAEDHAADALRYGCMSRPYVRDAIVPKIPRFDFGIPVPGQVSMGVSITELIQRAERARKEANE